MALYRLEAKIINRQNGSRSVVASAAYRSGNVLHSAAYRSGNTLTDERGKTTFDYRARTQEVAYSEIMAPKHAASWLQNAPPKGKEDMARQRALHNQLWRNFAIPKPDAARINKVCENIEGKLNDAIMRIGHEEEHELRLMNLKEFQYEHARPSDEAKAPRSR